MTNSTISSRKFRKHPGRARKAASREPVIITKHGRPTHVLLTIGEYQTLTGKQQSIVDALTMHEAGEIDFNPPRLSGGLARPANFS